MKERNLTCFLLLAVFLSPLGLAAAPQSVENLFLAKEHAARGDQYMAINLWDEAEQVYWKAVALDYANSKARKGLGDVYRKKEMYEKAIGNYQIVLNNQPNNVDIQYLISLSYYDNHQYEQARIAAEKALQMNPELAKAENLVRLSEAKQREQTFELEALRQKEETVLASFRQIQEEKEGVFIGSLIPGWRLIQTAERRTMWTGYAILGATAGLMLGGYFLRSAGQDAYDQATTAISKEYYLDRVDLGQTRFKYGGYMIDAALCIFALNLADSFLFKGKIFGGRTRVKPSLPDRQRHTR